MLAIERPSPFRNKFVIAALVFSTGFIGSLSILRVLQPDLGPLASSHVSRTVPHSSSTTSSQTPAKSTDGSSKQTAAATGTQSSDVAPVTPAVVDPPASSYVSPSPTTGTTQLSGQVAPANQSLAPSPTTVTQPAASPVTQPSAPSPAPTTSSLTAPVTSLAQPVTNTAQSLVPNI